MSGSSPDSQHTIVCRVAAWYYRRMGLFAAMFFLYLAALVLILGGEVNRVLEVRRIMRMQRYATRKRDESER